MADPVAAPMSSGRLTGLPIGFMATGFMAGMFRLLTRILLLATLGGLIAARPALAQQQILRDAETEALLHDATAPLIKAAGLDTRNVQVLIVNDKNINAFVAGGQIVWLNSGLITAADNINQIQGVVAHELGHIVGGHIIRASEGAREATGMQIISLLLGAAAMAAGSAEGGMGVLAAGQQAALGKYLAFTRTQEASADAAGAKFLSEAGISGKGSLQFFGKLENMEFRLSTPQDAWASSHPLTSDRIARLRAVYEKDPAWNKPIDPKLEARFERVKAKLIGYVDDPSRVLQIYPLSDQSIPAHYARAYAYHRSAYAQQAMTEVGDLLKVEPHDPYFLELKGQILLESGHPDQALPPLREATRLSDGQPLIATLLGHALVATEDDSHLAEAKTVLRAAIARDYQDQNPFAWYALGAVYAREGDEARAALANAEQYQMNGESTMALRSARVALAGIKQGTPDYLRAQDIEMVARAAMEKGDRR